MTISDLPVGAVVEFGRFCREEGMEPERLTWIKVHNDNTVLCYSILGGFAFDACESLHPEDLDRHQTGDNRYVFSNIRQYMNSTSAKWYIPQHEFDAPPDAINLAFGDRGYTNYPGFLSSFKEWEVESILPTELVCAEHTYRRVNERTLSTVTDLVFLPAVSNLLVLTDHRIVKEGSIWDYFETPPDMYFNEFEWESWTRTQCYTNRGHVYTARRNGDSNFRYASNGTICFHPALRLRPDIAVSEEENESGAYEVLIAPQEVIEITEQDLFSILY